MSEVPLYLPNGYQSCLEGHFRVVVETPQHPPHIPLWEGCRESRRCSRDTYPESYITKYTGIRRLTRTCGSL